MSDVTSIRETIAGNLKRVNDRIAAAATRAGRDASDVRLVAVTKYAEDEWVEALSRIHRLLGESRPQQLARRVPQFDPSIEWHLIGQLQRNKVRMTLPLCSLIHSIDSLRLLDRIDRIAAELDLRPRVLLEVNVSGEQAKSGFGVDNLREQWDNVVAYEHVNVTGLMTMAPLTEPDEVRAVFRSLRELRDELSRRNSDALELPELSMGMSGDFELAVEEGATLVRIGSSLFEGVSA